jgi:hypothetical protein
MDASPALSPTASSAAKATPHDHGKAGDQGTEKRMSKTPVQRAATDYHTQLQVD